VRFEIQPGWHLQSHRPSRDDLVATEVRARADGVAFGEPAYPPGKVVVVGGERLSTYSGDFEIPIPVTVSRDARPGEIDARLTFEFQACDDRRCLAPSRLELGATLQVAK
jgi:DsbC/DsbD-like thiol-disulfide interchange protein